MTPPILDTLPFCDTLCAPGTEAAERRFLWRAPWLVSPAYIGAAFRHPARSRASTIPGLRRPGPLRILASRLPFGGGALALATAAEAVLLEDEDDAMRVFYAGHDGEARTVKVVTLGSAHERAMRNEVETLERLVEYDTIAVPRVIETHEQGAHLFVIQEFVPGRRFEGRRDQRRFVYSALPQLLATYRRHGIRDAPLGDVLQHDTLPRVREITGEMDSAPPFLARLARILAADPAVPISLCHGDLVPSNLVISGGRIVFLTWERAREDCVVFDLVRFAMAQPRSRYLTRVVSAAAAQFVAGPDAFGDQLTAFIARRMLRDPKAAARLLAYWWSQVGIG